jgi:hypothetical protein
LPNIQSPVELRSPLARALRGLFNVPAMPESLNDDSGVAAALFVMACAGYSGPEYLSCAVRSAFPNPDSFMESARRLGFIEPPTEAEILSLRTVAELKQLADSLGVTIPKGAKAKLIQAISNSSSRDALSAYCRQFDFIKPSRTGCGALRALYDERITFEASVVHSFSRGDPDAISSVVADYRARRPGLTISTASVVLHFANHGSAYPVGLAHAYLCPVGSSTPFCLEQFQEHYAKYPDTPDFGFSSIRPSYDLSERIPETMNLDIQEELCAREESKTIENYRKFGVRRCQWMAHVSACERCKSYDDYICDIDKISLVPVHARCGTWVVPDHEENEVSP